MRAPTGKNYKINLNISLMKFGLYGLCSSGHKFYFSIRNLFCRRLRLYGTLCVRFKEGQERKNNEQTELSPMAMRRHSAHNDFDLEKTFSRLLWMSCLLRFNVLNGSKRSDAMKERTRWRNAKIFVQSCCVDEASSGIKSWKHTMWARTLSRSARHTTHSVLLLFHLISSVFFSFRAIRFRFSRFSMWFSLRGTTHETRQSSRRALDIVVQTKIQHFAQLNKEKDAGIRERVSCYVPNYITYFI